MKKTISIIIFVLALLTVGYFWQQKNNEPLAPIPQSGEWLVTINFEFAPDKITHINYNGEGEKSLFAITQEITSENKWGLDFKDYDDMGWLVTQIGTQANGQDNKYWQYYVNDKQPMISVEKFYPTNGDKITWKFVESEF